MTVQQTSMALGSWSVKLRPETPQDVIDQLDYLGHVAISTGRPDPRVSGDSLLTSARYVGVLRKVTFAGEGCNLSGAGMAYWLGDENDKGPIITAQLLYTAASFTTVVNGLLAQGQAVRAGAVAAVTGAYTGWHQYVTIRKALDLVCSTMTSDTLDPVEWRVNGDGTCDAGNASGLYNITNPTSAIVRRRVGVAVGADLTVRALPGTTSVDEDVADYATRVILLGQGSGLSIASAEAHLDPSAVPYRDLFGNTVSIARTVSQSSTDAANSLQQAQIALHQYAKPRDAVTLSSDVFDIEGDVRVGDAVWVHDPDSGLIDLSGSPAEITFRGERINPVRLRVSDMTWPVAPGMAVAFRRSDGTWIDLTDYVVWETGQTSITVGGYDRSLTNPTGRQETLGSRAAPNTSIPAAPAWTLPFVQAVYQSLNGGGITKSQVQLRWARPLNTDGTAIIDGDHYEIRYRTSDNPGYPSTWTQAAGKTWAQLGTWAQPVTYIPGPWQQVYAPFDTTTYLLQELTPGVPYDVQIRAVDNGVPPNFSAWSSTSTIVTTADTVPPPTPAAPTVASSLISVQITHYLGAAAGGTFNLPADLHHLEVHGQYEPTYVTSPATLLGKLAANNGMIASQTPVVGTFPVQSTAGIYVKVVAVDESGNRSNSSAPVQSSALLIDDSHISNLTVSKILAGTITTNWLIGADVATAFSGTRAGMNASGFYAFNAIGTRTFNVDAATGLVTIIGKLIAGTSATSDQVALDPAFASRGNAPQPSMVLSMSAGTNGPGFINATTRSGRVNVGINSGPSTASGVYTQSTIFMAPDGLVVNVNSGNPGLPNGGVLTMGTTGFTMEVKSGNTFGGASIIGDTGQALFRVIDSTDNANGGFINAQTSYLNLGYAPGNVVTSNIYLGAYAEMTAGASGQRGRLYLPGDSSNMIVGIDNFSGSMWGFAYYGSLAIGRIQVAGHAEVTNQTQASYLAIQASAFTVSSAGAVKKDFTALPGSALDVLRSAPLLHWRYKDEDDGRPLHVGPIAETLPEWLVEPARELPPGEVGPPPSEKISVMSWASLIAEAVRELDVEMDELRAALPANGRRRSALPARHTAAALLDDIAAGRLESRPVQPSRPPADEFARTAIRARAEAPGAGTPRRHELIIDEP